MKTYESNLPQFSLKKEKSDFVKVQITGSKHAEAVLRNFFRDDINIYESFFILLLNRANKTEGYVKISQGGTAGTVVDIKIIAKYVVDSMAHGVILCHNHPTGNKKPSDEDINITAKIKKALDYLDCKVLDHIILTEESYYSFADENII